MLEEMNQGQKAFQKEINNRFDGVNKRFDNIEINLAEVKKTTDIIKNEVGSLRNDMTVLKTNATEIESEQAYQFSKWGEHDSHIDKLERRVIS